MGSDPSETRPCLNKRLGTTKLTNRTRWQILCITVDKFDVSNWGPAWGVANGHIKINELSDVPIFVLPIAIRASTGHTQWAREYMLPLDVKLITHPLKVGSAMALGSCFHITTLKVLPSIIQRGIIAGGDGRERLMSYFTPYAPRDKVGCDILRPKKFFREVRIALFLHASNMVEYNARLDTDGSIVTLETIPFTAVAGAWYEGNGGKWRRLLVPFNG